MRKVVSLLDSLKRQRRHDALGKILPPSLPCKTLFERTGLAYRPCVKLWVVDHLSWQGEILSADFYLRVTYVIDAI